MPGSSSLIRAMQTADWEAVSRIYQAGMDTNLATFQTTCPPWEDWDNSHVGKCRLVAETDSAVIGWAALSPVSKRQVYAGVAEVSIYIDTSAQKSGVGTKLLQVLCREAEKEGFWTLQSGILPENQASIRLHEKCGFRLVGYREKIGKDRYGAWRDSVLMELRNSIV